MTQTQFHQFSSPAKLNLFLHIVGRRKDGYHELETLFQFVHYSDTLEIRATQSPEIKLLTPIEGVAEQDNLIYKAAKILQDKTNTQLGVEIKINKILPMGGGLGGGSSNAATVLMALNVLWHCQLSLNDLAKLGISLGADVPIFIHGFSAFAQGVGEKLTPQSPKEYWYLVSKPECSISTAEVFNHKELPRNTPRLTTSEIELKNCHNDCQTLVIKIYPKVAKLLSWLLEYAPSRMTGTGACIFSQFNSKAEALLIQLKLPPEVESFVAKGVNKSPLLAELEALREKTKLFK
ncbi:MAG: 4-(cytidine 5'-diphospho)-2-C-methyl-D-erythritol kinase [Colwellia sp.]|nr:4-(cytidine 5'-diphospho)-2-C-methyl-D-erythritol kinase [Colwellia sp.]